MHRLNFIHVRRGIGSKLWELISAISYISYLNFLLPFIFLGQKKHNSSQNTKFGVKWGQKQYSKKYMAMVHALVLAHVSFIVLARLSTYPEKYTGHAYDHVHVHPLPKPKSS